MKVSANTLMVIVAVIIAAMYAFGFIAPLNNKYENELQAQIDQSQSIVDSLSNQLVILDLENEALQVKSDSALAALVVEEDKRKQERDAFDRKIDKLSRLSATQLSSYFADRYNK